MPPIICELVALPDILNHSAHAEPWLELVFPTDRTYRNLKSRTQQVLSRVSFLDSSP
jgi:hypothetical protein